MIKKAVYPDSFNFDEPPVALIGQYSKGLDKQAMDKRASAFTADDLVFEKKAGYQYLHIITTGGGETYGQNRNCFVAGTPVNTANGIIPIQDVKVGDLVKTSEGEYHKVLRTISREYSGNLTTLKALGTPERVTMTSDHPVKVLKKKDEKYYYGRCRKGYGSSDEYVSEITKILTDDRFIPAETIEVGDLVCLPIGRHTSSASFINKTAFMKHSKEWCIDETSLEYAYIAGLWVAEGCVKLDDKEESDHKNFNSFIQYRHGETIFTLNTKKDTNSIDALYKFCSKNKLSINKNQHGEATNFRVTGLAFALQLVDLFGRGAHNKKLPDVVFQQSDEWKKHFIAGYLDGDGCFTYGGKSDGSVVASTVSISLALDIQDLLFTLGVTPSISKAWNRAYNGCFGKEDGVIYQIALCASQAKTIVPYCKRARQDKFDYSGKKGANKIHVVGNYVLTRITEVVTSYTEGEVVYNLEVEDNHTYCVPFVVHNCDYWNFDFGVNVAKHPKTASCAVVKLDGGLKKYHNKEYESKNAAVYKEHQTKKSGVEPSGYVVKAAINEPMKRGELIIGVDEKKWARELQKKANGGNIYFSIGADVPRDVCRVCNNSAHTREEYCDHAKNHLGKLTEDGDVVYVINDAPHFYDISGVATPADRTAFALKSLGGHDKKSSYGTPVLPSVFGIGKAAKVAAALKLSSMEKEIPAEVTDDIEEACCDEEVEGELINRLKHYSADEVIDALNRKGVMVSPKALYELLAEETDDPESIKEVTKDIKLDPEQVFFDIDDDQCPFCDELEDSSYDMEVIPNLGILGMIEPFLQKLQLSPEGVRNRTIQITLIKKASEKQNRIKKEASEFLSRDYAKYAAAFVARNPDKALFALAKVRAYSK